MKISKNGPHSLSQTSPQTRGKGGEPPGQAKKRTQVGFSGESSFEPAPSQLGKKQLKEQRKAEEKGRSHIAHALNDLRKALHTKGNGKHEARSNDGAIRAAVEMAAHALGIQLGDLSTTSGEDALVVLAARLGVPAAKGQDKMDLFQEIQQAARGRISAGNGEEQDDSGVVDASPPPAQPGQPSTAPAQPPSPAPSSGGTDHSGHNM